MTTRMRLRVAGALGGAWLVAVGSGCATSRPAPGGDLDVRRARSHFDLGVDHLQNGRVELGLRELLTSERLYPDQPRTQYRLAEAYRRKRKLEEAEAHLQRALELRPDYHEARLDLAALYIHLERYEEAIAESQILLDDPTFPAPWRALTHQGWARFKLGRNGEARRDLELAREYKRDYWPMLLNLGILESQEGHHLEAIRLFQEMLELRSQPSAEAEANYRLAEIYVSLGKREPAIEHLMTAVARTPDGRWGKKSEEYLKLLR